MDAQAILTISAAVVALVSLVKWMAVIPDRYGPVSVLAFAALGIGLWVWDQRPIAIGAFEAFAAWVSVSTSAAGIFGFTRASGTAMANLSAPPTGAGAEPTTRTTRPRRTGH